MSGLPRGWTWTTIKEISPVSPSQIGPQISPFTYIDISSINVQTKRVAKARQLLATEAPSRARQNVLENDILISLTRPNLNAVALVGGELSGSVASTGFHVLRLLEVEPKYIYFFAQSRPFIDGLLASVQGVVYPAVRPKDVAQIRVPLPPLAEQRRIVAEIEKQFTRLDEAFSQVRVVARKLSLLRESVLTFVTNTGKSHESTLLPSLPGIWRWCTLDDVISDIEAGKSFRCEERPPREGETGVLKVSAVTWGRFDENESKTCMDSLRIAERFLVKPSDFLFSRANTLELVGACVIVDSVQKRLMLSDKILRLRLRSVESRWILHVLRSAWGRYEIERLATGNQHSMRNIGQERIRAIRIPLPPVDEQRVLVEKLDRIISNQERLTLTSNELRARTVRLRQAILAKAFSGQLVPQDPDDEPASVLLECIRAERRMNSTTPRRRPAKRKFTLQS